MKYTSNRAAVEREIQARADQALERAAIRLLSQVIVPQTPVITGTLRRSETYRIIREAGRILAQVGSTSGYGRWVPGFLAALGSALDMAPRVLQEELRRALRS